ncbi:MAG: hypothetical protein ABTQ31_07885 [Rhizobiaceae bacterium]
MSRNFDWRKLQHLGKRKLSITDDEEYRSNDRAARWLARREMRKTDPKQKSHPRR